MSNIWNYKFILLTQNFMHKLQNGFQDAVYAECKRDWPSLLRIGNKMNQVDSHHYTTQELKTYYYEVANLKQQFKINSDEYQYLKTMTQLKLIILNYCR